MSFQTKPFLLVLYKKGEPTRTRNEHPSISLQALLIDKGTDSHARIDQEEAVWVCEACFESSASKYASCVGSSQVNSLVDTKNVRLSCRICGVLSTKEASKSLHFQGRGTHIHGKGLILISSVSRLAIQVSG